MGELHHRGQRASRDKPRFPVMKLRELSSDFVGDHFILGLALMVFMTPTAMSSQTIDAPNLQGVDGSSQM
jgi:hypothetical protein